MRTLIIIFVCLTTMSAQFGNDFFNVDVGARASAMGGAFTAVADDATAIAWNPAGLTTLAIPELSATFRYNVANQNFESNNIDKFDGSYDSGFNINFASFILPINLAISDISFVAAVAYRPIYDWDKNLEWKYSLSSGSERVYTEEQNGRLNAISASMAAKFDMLSFGMTVNKMFGVNNGKTELKINGSSNSKSEWDEDEYSSANVDLGIMIEPVEAFKVGITISAPYTLSFRQVKTKHKFEMDIPAVVNFGLALRLTDYLTLSYDHRSQDWKDFEIRNASLNQKANTTQQNYKLNSNRIGMEIIDVDESTNSITSYRFGFYQKPYLNDYGDSAKAGDDQIKNSVLSAGIGWVSDFMTFDIAGQWEHFKDERNSGLTQTVNLFKFNVGVIFYLGTL